jgi:o-succinylbenzoate synthase
MKIDVLKYRLDFKFKVGTSRGVMTSKDSFFIRMINEKNPQIEGIGECGPLPGLSPDLTAGSLEGVFGHCQAAFSGLETLGIEQLKKMIPGNFPAVLFGLETALMDLMNGGQRVIYNNQFFNAFISIPVNGLVWMGDKQEMKQRIREKIDEGYDCIKIKVGAINFEDELDLIRYIRKNFSKDEITIRLDANGGFSAEEIFRILDRLEAYQIHSIEQPVKAGNWKLMHEICRNTPIPVALDEELIGLHESDYKTNLLDEINPQYIVVKPTMVGGLRESEEWIQLAAQRAIGWWITSALESNIGLNAIAQFTANQKLEMPQGLGTGQLFVNNFPSPLVMENAKLSYDKTISWDLSDIRFPTE